MKKDLSKSLEVYEIMKKDKVEISAVTYGCLINACIKCENLTKAFELFEELNNSGIGKNCILYTTLITAYSKVRNVNKVLEIFDKMKLDKDNSPNNVTYNSVLNCLVTNDYLDIAEKILDELCSHKSLKPDIISFSTLIKGYIYQKDLRKPLKILSIMERLNIKPDEVLLNSLLDGCDKMNNYKAGVEIFRQVRKFIYPSLMSFSIMMKIYGKLGNYEESKNLINELRKNDEKISLIIYTCYMRTCFNDKRAEEAMEIFKEITSKKIEPDHVTFKTLVIGFTNCKCKEYSLISLNASITAQIRLDFEVYDKALWFLSSSFKDEEISLILQKLRNMNVHMNPKKYLKNHQALKKETVRTVGFDYLLENYKFKKDENVNEDNRTYGNPRKPVGNFNQDEKGKFSEKSSNLIVSSVNSELDNEKFSTNTPDNQFAIKVKGFSKEMRKPFNTVSTLNSAQIHPVLSKGFERGTKLSSYKIPSNGVISINENEIKKKEKVQRINRF
jgi:pentatricopeptide repeat protein